MGSLNHFIAWEFDRRLSSIAEKELDKFWAIENFRQILRIQDLQDRTIRLFIR